jgi:hypothetical protein
MAKGCLAALFGFGTRDGRAARKARAQQEAAKSGNRTADDVTPLLAAGVILGASGASSDDPKNGGMNEGNFHSGPEGYSPNTGYPDAFYGSGDFGGFDSGGDGGGGGD